MFRHLTLACVAGTMLAAGPAGAADKTHWSYTGEHGPAHWAAVDPAYASCGSGRMQSPIDLAAAAHKAALTVEVDYKPTPLSVRNNGHTIQVDYEPGSFITLNGERFELLQFHFHVPSEHARDGQRFPMEVHFVHRHADGRLAVVGVFLKEGADNRLLERVWAVAPHSAADDPARGEGTVDGAALLPGERSLYRYMGSLTTPPCSEGVNWLVMRQPMLVGAEQVAAFKALVGENARPLQVLNNRLLIGPRTGD